MIATTIEQSKHLLELGLDPKTADMVWRWYWDSNVENKKNWKLCVGKAEGSDKPAWSLSALLDVMPKEIISALSALGGNEMEILYRGEWVVRYVHFFMGELNGKLHQVVSNNIITAAYEMVVWLLENGHIEKGGQR